MSEQYRSRLSASKIFSRRRGLSRICRVARSRLARRGLRMTALMVELAVFRVLHAQNFCRHLRLQQMAQVGMKTFRLVGTSIRE